MKQKWCTKNALFIVRLHMHFIQRKQFSEKNVTSHTFPQMSHLQIFPECFCRPLNMLWQAMYGQRPCSWTTLIYTFQ